MPLEEILQSCRGLGFSMLASLKFQLEFSQLGLCPGPLDLHEVLVLAVEPHAVEPFHNAEDERHAHPNGQEGEGRDDLSQVDDRGALVGARGAQVLSGDPLIHRLAHLQ